MAIPTGTKVLAESMDPYDVVDFEVSVANLLEVGEGITSATLVLPTESTLLGLTIMTTGGYSTTLDESVLRFYLSIDVLEQDNALFLGEGALLPIEVRLTTDSVPARKKQRTIAVRVVQR